jgi:hypothetical protein
MTEYANPFESFGVPADKVSDNPFSIADVDTYNFIITDAEVKSFPKNPDIPYFVITFSVDGGRYSGRTANSMHRLLPWTLAEKNGDQAAVDFQNIMALTNYKKELLDLGIPAEAIGAFNPRLHGSKLKGIKGTATFGPQKGNPQYNSVSNVKVGASVSGGGVAPVVANAPSTSIPVATEPVAAENVASVLGNWGNAE